MRKFFLKNKLIMIFGIISIIIIFSYTILYYYPDYYKLENWYSLINNLSISYCSALIFYVIQIYIPTNKRETEAQKRIESSICKLIQFIEVVASICDIYINELNDKIVLDWDDKNEKTIKFIPYGYDTNSNSKRTVVTLSKEELIDIKDVFFDKLNAIKNKIEFSYCEKRIIELISLIEMQEAYFDKLYYLVYFENSFISNHSEYKKLQKKILGAVSELKKIYGFNWEVAVRKATAEEIDFTEAIKDSNAMMANSKEEFIKIAFKEHTRRKLATVISDEETLEKITDEIYQDVTK